MANVRLLASLLARLLVQLLIKSAKDSIRRRQPLHGCLFFYLIIKIKFLILKFNEKSRK